MNFGVLYVKSNPAAGYALKQIVGFLKEAHVFGSMEDGTTALPNGMMLDNAVLAYTQSEGDWEKTFEVDDVNTPTTVSEVV